MDAERMMMQKRIDNLIEQLELVKRQRDAAVRDMGIFQCDACAACKHNLASEELCSHAMQTDAETCFVWRGLCAENGGAEDEPVR